MLQSQIKMHCTQLIKPLVVALEVKQVTITKFFLTFGHASYYVLRSAIGIRQS